MQTFLHLIFAKLIITYQKFNPFEVFLNYYVFDNGDN